MKTFLSIRNDIKYKDKWRLVMKRKRGTDREYKIALDVIKESNQAIEENTKHTNDALDNMKSDIGEIRKNSTSKLSIVISIISLLVAISRLSGLEVYDRWKKWNPR